MDLFFNRVSLYLYINMEYQDESKTPSPIFPFFDLGFLLGFLITYKWSIPEIYSRPLHIINKVFQKGIKGACKMV